MNWYFLAGINVMESMFRYKHEYRYMSTCTYMCIVANRDNYNSFRIFLEFICDDEKYGNIQSGLSNIIFTSLTLQCNA